jgi:hypothetical protein
MVSAKLTNSAGMCVVGILAAKVLDPIVRAAAVTALSGLSPRLAMPCPIPAATTMAKPRIM